MYVCMYVCTRVLPSISIDNGILLALQFGSICKSFGIVQWSRTLFRHCSWVAIAEVLDYFKLARQFGSLTASPWPWNGVLDSLMASSWPWNSVFGGMLAPSWPWNGILDTLMAPSWPWTDVLGAWQQKEALGSLEVPKP